MGTRTPICPEHKANPKRAIAKKKRNRGQLAMGNFSQAQWAQKHDPLFRVKGAERHRQLHEMR